MLAFPCMGQPIPFSSGRYISNLMVDENEIPEGKKWLIASRLVSRLPVMYDIAFRKIVGDSYDTIERDIWIELAKEAKTVADAFRLPTKTAPDLAVTYRIIANIFFGPAYTMEHIRLGEDRSVIRITRCPFVFCETEMHCQFGHLFSRCLTFSVATIEILNPEYTLRFVRSMCMGDKSCEMKIVKKDTVEEKEQGKKKET